MNVYPINLDIRDRRCLVVGGGAVALRKVEGLLACGGRVEVVSPAAADPLAALADRGAVTWRRRAYRAADMQGAFMVIAATDREAVNRRVAADARTHGVLCNVVDRPAAGSFTVPSAVRRGDLLLTVSTAGRSPALAKRLRQRIEAQFGAEYADLLRLLGTVRQRLLDAGHDPGGHRDVLSRLVAADLETAIRRGAWDRVRRTLQEVLGDRYDGGLLERAGLPADPVEGRERN